MKTVSHQSITELAIEQYTQILAPDSALSKQLSANARYAVAIVAGSRQEDHEDVFLTRLRNWHFYPANPMIQKSLPVIEKGIQFHSLGLLNRRQYALSEELISGVSVKAFNLLGRILHHIQDMSTPSHVTPVYHGLTIWDPFESYVCKYWSTLMSADHSKVPISVTHPDILAPYSEDEGDIEVTGNNYFVRLYHQAAHQSTIQLANTSFSYTLNEQPDVVCLTGLWVPYDVDHPDNNARVWGVKTLGFGHFGPIARHFGKPYFTDDLQRRYQIEPSDYMEVAHQFVQKALLDTIRGLVIFDGLLHRTGNMNDVGGGLD